MNTPDNQNYPENGRQISQADCIIWTGVVNNWGYGVVRVGPTTTSAHRAAWIASHGPIPTGLVVDHLCRNRRCVNVDHLEPVTVVENTRRSPRVNPSHCPHGHPMTGDNVYIQIQNGSPRRSCRVCRNQRSKGQS